MSLTTLGAKFADIYVNDKTPQAPPARLGITSLREVAADEQPAGPSQAISDALKSLTTYIPGEVLTFYLGATAAIVASTNKGTPIPSSYTFWTFWICVIATPIWAYFAVYLASATRPPFKAVLWPMVAGTIAFAAYAFAVPDGMLATASGNGALFATLAVLGVTPLLHLGGLVYTRLVS